MFQQKIYIEDGQRKKEESTGEWVIKCEVQISKTQTLTVK